VSKIEAFLFSDKGRIIPVSREKNLKYRITGNDAALRVQEH
jgi:hypothetical protein